uniref:zinc finger protein 93-like isoform X1 n=2 Tax=Styela clava TaxID=7725 RepID=UPI00193A99D9|nr:zinc finger protein 93-like isoform X1 [Styela clava]XP_039256448.1 zinc finger protein 93-like isoform X1 [Styela clava]
MESQCQNAEEFFQHLKLSKCNDNNTPSNKKLPSVVIRKYPLTRYHHNALINRNKRPNIEALGQDESLNNTKSINPKKRKKLSLAEKIKLLKESTPELKEKVGEPKKLNCDLCQIEFNSKHDYEKHTYTVKHIFKTEMEIGTDQNALSKEKEVLKTQTNTYKCIYSPCCAEFDKLEKFLRHHREHTGVCPYLCTRCKSKFKVKSDLASHLKRHLGMKNISCDHCDMTFTKTRCLVQHLITKHGEKDIRSRNFKCTECGEAFLSKAAVDRHMRWHTGYRPETCHECGMSFHTRFDLNDHLRIHSGEKPYKCEDCEYKARTAQLLKRHRKIHTLEKPFTCKECDFKCSSSSSLKRHTLIHSGKKPYKCPYCSHRSANIENLRKHIKKVAKHKGLKIYPCSHCPALEFSTDDGAEFLLHMKQYHFPNLDLKSVTATKLSGIQIDDVNQEAESENEDEITGVQGRTVFDRSSDSLLQDSGLSQEALANMQPSSLLPELGLRSTLETLNESDLRCLDPQMTNKGDVFLSSMAPIDNNDLRKRGPFEAENTVSETLSGSSMTTPSQENGTANPEINLNQGYLALLVKWPSNQNVEVQQGPVEGCSSGVPLTLVVNSSPMFLSALDNTPAEPQPDNSNNVQAGNGRTTYTISHNGLCLTDGSRTAKPDSALKTLQPVTFDPIPTEKNVNTSASPQISETPKNTFMTKSSIHVPNQPPNILTVSPEKVNET